jgi:hypothetical protein
MLYRVGGWGWWGGKHSNANAVGYAMLGLGWLLRSNSKPYNEAEQAKLLIWLGLAGSLPNTGKRACKISELLSSPFSTK